MQKKPFFPPVYLFLNKHPLDLLLWRTLNEFRSSGSTLNNHSSIDNTSINGNEIINPLRIFLPEKIDVRTKYHKFCKDNHNNCVKNINLKDVVYITSNNQYSKDIFLETNYQAVVSVDKKSYYLHQQSLSELTKKLPYYFVQINQSIIVNLLHIEGVNNNEIYISGTGFHLTKKYKEAFYKRYDLYRIRYS